VRFADRAYSGEVRLCGTNQIVFLHGGTLARYDLKSKKEIWSHELITRQQIADEAAQMSKLGGRLGRQPAQDKLAGMIEREMTSGLLLRISGQNLWVSAPGKLTHYDWNTGRVLQEIPLTEGSGEFIARGDELLMLKESETGRQFITHISLANGETHTEIIGRTGKPAVASSQNAPGAMVMASAGGAGGPPTAGLPVGAPGADMGKPMDPAKVAAQAQSLPLPARIALPAVLANSMHQERIQSELDDQPRSPEQQAASAPRQVAAKPPPIEPFSLIPGKYGYVQFAVRLLESRIVTREAMKAPPKRSVLDGDLNITKTVDAANEILNDMQRSRGGNIVEEDVSRYQVTLRRPDSTETRDWTGEVIGPPGLFPLKTVNVLTAGKTLVVFDKTNKKLWQSALTHPVTGGAGARGGEEARLGEGPCVERGDTLFVFDQAVLTAFDLATGNARWRLPSVGVAGLFFDDQGMLYVNTTTASPENIKYSRQIDISDKTDAVFLKIDPRTGKTLWSIKPGGFISYLSGKYIYTFQSYDPGDEEDGATMLAGVSPNPPFVRIRRINPENGRILWDYQQGRAPFDVQFNGNSIGLVFKKEVQVLKFLSF
jgi:hypothetical protein